MELFERLLIVLISLGIAAWSGSHCINNSYSLGRSFIHGFICGAISVIGLMITFYILHLLGLVEVEMERLIKGSVFIIIFGVAVGAYSSYRVIAHDNV